MKTCKVNQMLWYSGKHYTYERMRWVETNSCNLWIGFTFLPYIECNLQHAMMVISNDFKKKSISRWQQVGHARLRSRWASSPRASSCWRMSRTSNENRNTPKLRRTTASQYAHSQHFILHSLQRNMHCPISLLRIDENRWIMFLHFLQFLILTCKGQAYVVILYTEAE